MDTVDEINKKILSLKQDGINIKKISDGHHTFENLYFQRMILVSVLLNNFPELSWKSKKHYDNEIDPMFNDDFIAGINTPEGMATWHFKLEYWDNFQIKEIERSPKYDGYGEKDTLSRIKSIKNINKKI